MQILFLLQKRKGTLAHNTEARYRMGVSRNPELGDTPTGTTAYRRGGENRNLQRIQNQARVAITFLHGAMQERQAPFPGGG